jgi:tetratricopeptide (TPR) repeat protein
MTLGKSTNKHWKPAACALMAALLVAQPALAQDGSDAAATSDVQLAEQRAAQAFEAYQNKEYVTSVALYLEAFKAAPSADLLYNIARIYDAKLGDRQLAITFYRKYISDPGAVAERIKRANERLIELREAEVAAGSDRPGKEARPAAAPLRDGASRSSTASQMGIVLGVAGLVGVGVGTGFGLAAMSKANTAKDTCNGNACTTQKGVDAAHDASSNATISTVGFATGGALLATGVILYFWGGARKQSEAGKSVHFEPVATPSRVGFEIGGAW